MPPRKLPSPGSSHKPPLRLEEIRSWAEQYYRLHQKWPVAESGPIPGTTETWNSVARALSECCRGLPHGHSLSRLLDHWFPHLRPRCRPPLTFKMIIDWARQHHRRTGRWPNQESGRVLGHPDENWRTIANALRYGSRGLRGGDSLAGLLRRGIPGCNPFRKQKLTLTQIRMWAKTHRSRWGRWPSMCSGEVFGEAGLTWRAVYNALRHGYRGLPGGMTLRQVLGLPHRPPPRLTVNQILECADDYHQRTGNWPVAGSVIIPHLHPQVTWQTVNSALRHGDHGLPGGFTLAGLLKKHRGITRDRRRRSPVRVGQEGNPVLSLGIPEILARADEYRQKTGNWPTAVSGRLDGFSNVSWFKIHIALRRGAWGRPAGGSLTKLLVEHRSLRRKGFLPPLSERQILKWADTFYALRGRWPAYDSGSIPEAPGETWGTVHRALWNGLRGLSGHRSLRVFLNTHNRRQLPLHKRRLSEAEIVCWARLHHQRSGEWPRRNTGPILDAPGETWSGVDSALNGGGRGLPGASSLRKLLHPLEAKRRPDRAARISTRHGRDEGD